MTLASSAGHVSQHTHIEAIRFYRAAFLQHTPPHHAAMQPQARYDQTGKKYDDRRGDLSDNQIAALLRGQVAYAVPYAAAGLASVLVFDIDSDHLPDPAAPIRALLAELERRDLWAFAQYDPDRRRGYVWAPFADLAHAGRLAVLGDAILAAVNQPGWNIEHRTSQANAQSDTRLPLCRHTWTGRRGLLLLDGQQLDLDADPAAGLDTLIAAWRPNPLNRLPDPPAPAPTHPTRSRHPSSTSDITIDRYNQDTDLIALLESYGATHSTRRTMHCCGHPDQRRASLVITIKGDRVLCQCMSAHHNCPLSGRRRDAFGVYCAMQGGLTSKQALKKLREQHGEITYANRQLDTTRTRQPIREPRGLSHPSDHRSIGRASITRRDQQQSSTLPRKTILTTETSTPNSGTTGSFSRPRQDIQARANTSKQRPHPTTHTGEPTNERSRTTTTHPQANHSTTPTQPTTAPTRQEELKNNSIPTQPITTPTDGRRSAAEHPKLSKSALHILAEIARHPTGYILGKNRLAQALDIDRTTVRRNLRVLEQAGAIRTQRRGGGHTDVYHACPHSERGGQMPPTCIHESDLTPESDSAGRGGQAVGSFAPQAHDQADETPASVLALADDQADEAPASVLALADDQADILPPRDELVCGAELTGPAGAFVVVGGAAYVPSGTESWYAAICAAIAPPPGEQPDDQAEPMQLVASLDAGDLAERDASTGQPGAGDLAEPAQPSSMPSTKTKTNRTASKRQRDQQAYQRQLDRMSGPELAGQLKKWHNTEKKRGKAGWSTDRIKAVQREIERRDLLGGLPSNQADSPGSSPDADDQADMPSPDVGSPSPEGSSTGVGLPPPACSIGFGDGFSSRVAPLRRSWRSPVARCDWDTPPALEPPALPAPCVPVLPAGGWTYERDGSAWRAVHVAGYMTAPYINPEAAGRAVERRDYYPVAS